MDNNNTKTKARTDGGVATKLKTEDIKEYRKLYMREYRKKNPEKIKNHKKQYRERNKLLERERNKRYREENRQKLLEKKRKYREENKEKIAVYNREYKKKNKELDAIHKNVRRTRKKEAFTFYNMELWEECKEYFKHKCCYCGKAKPLSQDHFVPVSKGGDFTVNNIVPSCRSCNSSKNNSDFFEWFPTKEFYSKERERKILRYLKYNKNKQQQLALI